MRRKKTSSRVARSAPESTTEVTSPPDDERLSRVRERPDGYHWIDVEGRQEFGPFDSMEAALADMEGPVEQVIEQRAWAEQTLEGLTPEEPIDRTGDDELTGIP